MLIEDMAMYVDVPETYLWDSKQKVWKERLYKKAYQIGRIHTVPHTAGDVFYLRMLLNHEHSRGKTAFDDMLTLPSGQCETYKQVCEQLGLLQDDGEWIEVLSEGALTMSSKNLRNLYMMIIVERREESKGERISKSERSDESCSSKRVWGGTLAAYVFRKPTGSSMGHVRLK